MAGHGRPTHTGHKTTTKRRRSQARSARERERETAPPRLRIHKTLPPLLPSYRPCHRPSTHPCRPLANLNNLTDLYVAWVVGSQRKPPSPMPKFRRLRRMPSSEIHAGSFIPVDDDDDVTAPPSLALGGL